MKKNFDVSRRADNAENISRVKEWLNAADAVIIGAGAGLSTSAGFAYSGERFERYFADFSAKYGFNDMYSGGFYPYLCKEEFWAYWSRYIWINRYDCPAGKPYETLLDLVRDKNYFVLTTNVDHRFQVAGFDKKRLFYTQGDYGLFQCSVPCHNRTYDNKAQVRAMLDAQKNMRIPSELVPRCPVCGRPMTTNLRADDRFVEDEGWHAACRRYTDFLRACDGGRVLFLELGVGMNTPGIIKYPFIRMTYENANARYVCVNLQTAYAPEEIADRSVCLSEDIGGVLERLVS